MSPKVKANRQRKMAEIRETALEIILESGIEQLSMHEVARRRGVTVGALYRYYDSKQDLVVQLELECLASLRSLLSKLAPPMHAQVASLELAKTSLLQIVESYRDALARQPAYGRLISGILATPIPVLNPTDRSGAVQKMFDVLSIPCECIEWLRCEGIFSSGDSMARALTLWVTVHGLLQLRKMEPISNGRIDVDDLLRQAVFDSVSGWSKLVDNVK